MRTKKQKRPLEAVNGLYGALPHMVLDCAAFKGSSYSARALLLELIRQHNGVNNGQLHLSFSWLKKRGWNSRDVIQRAKSDLIERNLIIQTRQGGLNAGPSRFALTWLHISNIVGLDIQRKNYHSGAWGLLDKAPINMKIANTVPSTGRDNTCSW